MSDFAARTIDAIEKAKNEGFEVVSSTETTLLLDLDGLESLIRYEKMLSMVGRIFPSKEQRRWRSKSGENWHIIVELEKALPPAERVALQSILGSDPNRDVMSLRQILDNSPVDPIILFKPAPAKESEE
jgi:hypothetical protein